MDDFATGFIAGQSDGNGGNGNGFGGGWGGAWEGIWGIIILAMVFGWGNGGWGGFGGGGNGAVQGALTRGELCQDMNFQSLENATRGIQQGLCDGFYAVNTSLMNGFHGVDNAVCTLGYQTQQGFSNANVVALQNQNALQSQIAQCCCDNKAALADLKYDMATSDCSIKTLVNQLAQQLMWGQQNGLRDLTDLINNKFCQLEMSQKDAIIADLRTQLAQCGDQNMANAIVSRLTAVINPPAVPAYPAANPNGFGNWAPQVLNGGGYSYNGCGCNSGCNSGCGF